MGGTLDLDALAPEPINVKLGGKIFSVKPLTTRQLLDLVKFLTSLQAGANTDDIEKIRNVLKSVIPEFDSLDLYTPQLVRLVEYMVMDTGLQAAKETEAKKGGASEKPSPTS